MNAGTKRMPAKAPTRRDGEPVATYLSYAKPFSVTRHEATIQWHHGKVIASTPLTFTVRDAEDTGLCGCDRKQDADLIADALNAYKGSK